MRFFFLAMQEHFQSLSDLQVGLLCFVFGGACGGLSYGVKVTEGKPFRWGEFFIFCATSAVCGLCTFEVLDAYGAPSQVAGALCGMSGWMGTRLPRMVEALWLRKHGVSKEDL